MGKFDRAFRESDLLFKYTVMKKKVEAFESGEKYVRMQEEIDKRDRRIKALESEITKLKAKAEKEKEKIRDEWIKVCDDVNKEADKKIAKTEKEKKKAENEKFAALRKHDEALDKLHLKNIELYEVKTQLEEAQEKIKLLTSQCKKDYTNSSKSSSMSPNHKKISNNRVPSGKKPGGQKGHPHYGRKRRKPDQEIEIPAPEKFKNSKEYKPTGRMIRKQLVIAQVNTRVIEYLTPEFQEKKTGKKVHAAFPEGIKDDVNYDGTVKALAYLLTNECFVSIDKTRTFLKEISNGSIDLSNGMICNLSREFSEKTKAERELIFKGLISSDSMHADFTFGRKYGKQATVLICSSDDLALYQAKDKKGIEGVKGSPVEVYQGTVISDHESTFLNYGTRHQECLVHIERKLREIMEMESEKTWAADMLGWIQKTIHYWKEVRSAKEPYDAGRVEEFMQEYDKIVATAKDQYEYEPPSKMFRDGYNLYRRLEDDKEGHVLFLKDISVEPNNNKAEQLARQFKRKAKQVMCFRSDGGVEYFCDGLSVLNTLKARGENLYVAISSKFNTLVDGSG